MRQADLWRASRRGTLIVSDPRFGTHFLQKIVADRVRPHRAVDTRSEIDKQPEIDQPIRLTLAALAGESAYQVAIVNSVNAKTELLADPGLLEPWHVIRLTRRDKVGWMRSWAWFFLHPGSEVSSGHADRLLHHGTSAQSYIENLHRLGPVELTPDVIKDIASNLCLHALSPLIPADEEIDYGDLPGLQSEHTWWKGNDYPDLSMQTLFPGYDRIRPLLEAWSAKDVRGRFRTES